MGLEKLMLSLAVCMVCFTTSLAEIRHFKIRNDGRPVIPLDQFGFTRTGRVVLNVTGIQLSISVNKVNSPFQLSKVGFFLCTPDSWFRVLQQYENGEISCALESRSVKTVCTFDSLVKPDAEITTATTAFDTLFWEDDADQYNLLFANCFPQLITVSMDVRSAMYNIEGKTGVPDYLSVGRSMLPMVYFLFSLVYLSMAALWISILYKKRLTIYRIQFFMLALVFLKTLNLLFEAEDKSYIKRTGSAHGWDVLFYIFSFLKGITLFTIIVLIGTGWSFLKPYLQDKEKKILMVVIPLQILANVAQVGLDESGPYDHGWITWKRIFLLVDVVCCCAVLFPIVWSMKKLRDAARTDGKAAANLAKLRLFRQYYIVVICYIYFTRVVIYALEAITSYHYSWTSVVAAELATLVFYVYTGYKFKPEAHNPYFVINDENEEAVAEA